MASSLDPAEARPAIPDGSAHTSDDDVRWPLVAKLGVALAVLTLVGIVVAAVIAAFVVGPRDDNALRQFGVFDVVVSPH